MPENEVGFWVAELMHSGTGQALGGWYWDGNTTFPLVPTTTQDIDKAVKWRSAEACQDMIERISYCKAGILVPTEHSYMMEPKDDDRTTDQLQLHSIRDTSTSATDAE